MFLLLILLFLVILGIISYIFALFLCLIKIILCAVPLSYQDNTPLLSLVYFTADILNIFKTFKAVFIFYVFFHKSVKIHADFQHVFRAFFITHVPDQD
jgi:hypothetical protein